MTSAPRSLLAAATYGTGQHTTSCAPGTASRTRTHPQGRSKGGAARGLRVVRGHGGPSQKHQAAGCQEGQVQDDLQVCSGGRAERLGGTDKEHRLPDGAGSAAMLGQATCTQVGT